MRKAEWEKIESKYQKDLKERKKYLLDSFGSDWEEFITKSTLKKIFSDRTIQQHFPKPFYVKSNPFNHVPHKFIYLYGDAEAGSLYRPIQFYRLADVLEKIALGVKPRLKESLLPHIRSIVTQFVLDKTLKDKSVKTSQKKLKI